jgi:hypothetical protein
MFYLKEFFKGIGEAPLRGASFFLFSCLLALGLTHRPWLAKTIEQITPEKMVNPYFVAVIDGAVDAQRIKAVVAELPGILAVDDKESERSRSKLSALVGALGSDYSLDENLMNFKSLRIVMSPQLSTESLDFVRSQVLKMGGAEHITATDIKYPEVTSVMKAHPFYEFLGDSGDWGLISIIALCWVISFWLCYQVFRSRAYIIEKFQRRNLVAAKTIAVGLGGVFALFTALGIWNGTLKFFDSVVLFMIFSVFWTFTMQEWRWKPTL